MKKKIILTSTILLASLALASCSTNQSAKSESSSLRAENASLKAGNSSLKAKKPHQNLSKFNDSEYALAAYLKLQGQTANELKNNEDNMHWDQDGNTYHIDFGAHTTSMTVTEDNVEVTYDKPQEDSMGHDNGHKTYSKQQLAKEFGNQKGAIDEILESVSQRRAHNDVSANNGQQTKISNNTSSPAKQSSDDHQTDTGNSDNDDNSSDFHRNIPSINTAVTSSANPNANTAVTSSANPNVVVTNSSNLR